MFGRREEASPPALADDVSALADLDAECVGDSLRRRVVEVVPVHLGGALVVVSLEPLAPGSAPPDSLGHLLRGHELLASPRAADDPANAILDAAADGTLDEKLLAKLLPVAAAATMANQCRQELASRAERMLVQRWYRTLKAGAADQVISSMRSEFNRHAEQIAHAKSVGINSESTLEHLVATGESGLVEAWNDLGGHIAAITAIANVASQFGSRPTATFPQLKEFTAGHVHLLDDRALMACDGGLLADSSLFRRPDTGHRSSPFFQTILKLHSISSAQQRHDQWAADEHDRIHRDRPRGGKILEDGVVAYDPIPPNPFQGRAGSQRMTGPPPGR